MALRRHSVTRFLELLPGALLLDVRSPSEYAHAQLPGALSLPLFSDAERAQVGTAYKQVSREAAIKIGLDHFGPKMRAMIETVERTARARDLGEKPPICVYCWRGGMRSGAVAWLLDLYGFDVHVLDGGYKSFRNYVLETFTLPLPLRILGGYTGSGKTELLHELKTLGETVIDLEGLACHKGSAFGNIDMPPQPTQEQFENLLALEIRAVIGSAIGNRESAMDASDAGSFLPVPEAAKSSFRDVPWSVGPNVEEKGNVAGSEAIPDSRFPIPASRPIWLEDESQRIGQLHIPHRLWATMRQSPVYFLDIPFEQRLAHIVEEYGVLDRERLRDAIDRIRQRLGGLDHKLALQHLDEDNLSECFAILLRYYDKHYGKGLQNRTGLEQLLHRVPCADVRPDNAHALIRSTQ
ncbi:hypothetical protein GCM10023184_34030 [Flaviaesturariibacter amylovorans]|uniref:Rhodanese domain-containing protein n=2 Tax=Flaviaesturariibacter amylovorans TaxID=1084520 RepID=A0ABP8HE74_9BACT